jgi:chromosome segregation ATPase
LSRTSSPELLEANKIIADKDNMIERLRKENEDLLKQHNTTSHQGPSIAIQQQQLESELSGKDTMIKELKIQIDGLIEQQLEAIKSNNSNEKSGSPSRNDQHGNSIMDFEMSLQ